MIKKISFNTFRPAVLRKVSALSLGLKKRRTSTHAVRTTHHQPMFGLLINDQNR
ncbi:MAG: hypothetical protein ACTJHW_04695 [Paenalcaligenes sp.]